MNFGKHPMSGDIRKKTGDDAIKQAIRNLILTQPYERPFHPEISSSVRQMLFENISPLTAISIARSIREVLLNFEPRIKLHKVTVRADSDNNGYEASIMFWLLNVEEPVIINEFLHRLR